MIGAITALACRSHVDGDGEGGARIPSDEGGLPRTPDAPSEPSRSGTLYRGRDFFSFVVDAQGSPEGYGVVLEDVRSSAEEPVRRILRLVATPAGPADVELSALFSASSADAAKPIVSISSILGAKLLVARADEAGAELAMLDLSVPAVAWVRPVEDPSGAPRPIFDAAGSNVGERTSRPLPDVGPFASSIRVALFEDGSYAHTVFAGPAAWLFRFAANGALRFRAPIVPHVQGVSKAVFRAELAGGRDGLHVLTYVQRAERAAFRAVHPSATFTQEATGEPIVLAFDEGGTLREAVETVLPFCTGPLHAVPTALDVHGRDLTWTGTCGPILWVAARRAGAATVTARVPVEDDAYSSSVAWSASGEEVFVAGSMGLASAATGSVLRPGDAFVARWEPGGSMAVSAYRSPRNDLALVKGSAEPLVLLNYEGPITHSSGEDRRCRSWVASWTEALAVFEPVR